MHDVRVPVNWVRAFIRQGRLPLKERWERRDFTLSLLELTVTNKDIRRKAKDIRL